MGEVALVVGALVGLTLVMGVVQRYCFRGMDQAVAEGRLERLSPEDRDAPFDRDAFKLGVTDALNKRPPIRELDKLSTASYLRGYIEARKSGPV